ncbi:hypothetical protein QZM52_07060 [Burkholderia metallica]|uniref:Uncharacterized protein n=1 Tax=Burkholderia metallica TaxID=488729 RepID=A0ABT8P7I4_9BURK|nr:hypothetical protein [Burkholderia metallica]MDN7931051.1 hypothetical protein [Burkholderia metallica]
MDAIAACGVRFVERHARYWGMNGRETGLVAGPKLRRVAMLSIEGVIGGMAEPAEHATTLDALFPNWNEC